MLLEQLDLLETLELRANFDPESAASSGWQRPRVKYPSASDWGTAVHYKMKLEVVKTAGTSTELYAEGDSTLNTKKKLEMIQADI